MMGFAPHLCRACAHPVKKLVIHFGVFLVAIGFRSGPNLPPCVDVPARPVPEAGWTALHQQFAVFVEARDSPVRLSPAGFVGAAHDGKATPCDRQTSPAAFAVGCFLPSPWPSRPRVGWPWPRNGVLVGPWTSWRYRTLRDPR